MFFRQKSKQKEYEKIISKLDQRLEKLEEVIQQLAKQGINYHVSIDQLDVHDPVLENLTFQFDHLDVKEVSGALNLGNNFGVRVDQEKGKRKEMERQGKKNSKGQGSSGQTHSPGHFNKKGKSSDQNQKAKGFKEGVDVKQKDRGYTVRFKSE